MLTLCLFVWILLLFIEWRRYKKIINPFLLETYFVVGFMIIPQLVLIQLNPEAKSSFYSDLVIMVFIISIFLGARINIKTPALKPIANVSLINSLNVVLYAGLILPIIPFFLSAPSIRAFYETVVFTKYASFFDLSRIVLYFVILFKLIQHQRFTIAFFLLFPLVFLYGSRFVILDLMIYTAVFLEQFKEVRFSRLIFLGVAGGAAIAIFTLSQFESAAIQDIFVSYFDIYKNQSFLVEQLMEGKLEYYYGEINFSSFLKYVPRILWEDKPKAFGFAILNYHIFPEQAAQGYMPSFGLGSVFADFGFASIFWVGLLNGFIRNFFYRTFLKRKNNLTFFLYVFPFSLITNIFLLFYIVFDHVCEAARNRNISGSAAIKSTQE